MGEAPYIDIHTHNLRKGSHIKMVSLMLSANAIETYEGLFSVGIHPYHADIDLQYFDSLWSSAPKGYAAIGEIGLDRSIGTPITQQQAVFDSQLAKAEAEHKPAVIHCVKAYSDMLASIKQHPSITYLFHAFYASEPVLVHLLRYTTYFSMGLRELNKPKGKDLLRKIPLDRLFLETDEDSTPIETAYDAAAAALCMPVGELKMALYANFKRLF